MDDRHFSKFNQICRLLYVVGAGIATAIILSLISLYYYNPSGVYPAKNVLLNTEVLSKLQPNGEVRKKRAGNTYYLQGIDYSSYDSPSMHWSKKSVSKELYEEFYRLVEGDSSIADVTEDIKGSFTRGRPSVLSIRVSGGNDPATTFTDVVFAENGDYYKVMLREQSKGEGWAYFHHPGIYQKVQNLFGMP